MARELRVEEQSFRLTTPHMLSRESALKQLCEPCGMFRSPLSLEERLQIILNKAADRANPLGDSFFIHDGIPLNWHALLAYLHKHKIAGTPTLNAESRRNDMPRTKAVSIPSFTSRGTDTRPRFNGHGSGNTVEDALSRAVGELLERHFLAEPATDALTILPYGDEPEGRTERMNISQLNDFLPWQVDAFPALSRTAGRPLAWIRGQNFTKNHAAFMPAQLVFWSYRRVKGELILSNSSTNGAAGHFSRAGAILSGLLEAIQRDGFLIYWLNNLTPTRIDARSVQTKNVHDLLDYADRYRIELHFMDVTTDLGVPTVICAALDRTAGHEAVSIGGAAGFNGEEMFLQSAREALSVLGMVARSNEHPFEGDYKPFLMPSVRRRQRLLFWRGREMLTRFQFFISGDIADVQSLMRNFEVSSTEAGLTYVQHALSALGAGYDIYLYEAHHPVLERLGYHVVKTIVPRLVPLHLIEHRATLDAPRLREVPAKLGHAPAQIYNPWPHPFP